MDILDRTILNIFNLPFLDIISPVNIPNNLFGVFVTIHRHNKLKNYPYDIHGCIGYWDDNYKTVSSKLIYDKIMTVSKDAMYNDNRREYFRPIETDPLSTIEINYMQQPLYKIDPDTGLIPELGTYFNNNKYGLIVHHSNGNKATYLPKVFEKISWNGIKKSISSKAGININNKINNKNGLSAAFYAYKTKIITKPIFNILLTYRNLLFQKFADLVSVYYDQGIIPFMIDRTGKITSDNNEVIRNTSVISIYLKAAKKRSISKKILNYFLEIYTNEQTIANIITLLTDFGYNDLIQESQIQKIIKKIPTAEAKFERPQILIALIKYYHAYKGALKYIDTIDKSDVFMLNWYSNLLTTIDNIKITTKPAIMLMNMFLELNKNKELSKYETNYLAVIFEGMMHLHYILPKNTTTDAYSLIFRVFLELMKRYDTRNGTFKFLSNESRLDITCHILNGLLVKKN
jgi:hypothetical protein